MDIHYFIDCKLIYESDDFYVIVPKTPHIDREDGGHICIVAKDPGIGSLQQLDDDTLIELSLLTRTVGAAMTEVLNRHGVDVKLINYQLNGNWTYFEEKKPSLHVHLYGRALSARIQKFGTSLYFPKKSDDPDFYKNNRGLNDDEIEEINKIIVSKMPPCPRSRV